MKYFYLFFYLGFAKLSFIYFIYYFAGIPSIKLSNLPLPTCKWKRKRCVVLLQVYAKYKAELSRPGVEEKHEVWRKIADEVRKRCSALKCNESQCMNKIEELRKTYQELKTQSVMTKGMLILFNEAKNAFETSKNSGKPKNIKLNKEWFLYV